MPPEREQQGNGSGVNVEVEDELQSGSGTGEETNSETDGSGSSEQGNGDQGGSREEPRQFQHPLLRGKSPEEVERIVQSLQDANRSMNTELNRRTGEQPTAPTPGGQPAGKDPLDEAPDYGDSFIAPHLRTMEERIARRLEKAVGPLQQSHRQAQAESSREKLGKELKHFKVLETSIDQLIRDQGGDPNTAKEGQLRLLYHTAVGLATERGINLNQGEAPAPQGGGNGSQPAVREQEQQPVGIPQHRPSGAPLPKPQGQRRRVLSEDERRLAKEFFPDSKDPEGDYIREQDADEGDVVQPGFSKKSW